MMASKGGITLEAIRGMSILEQRTWLAALDHFYLVQAEIAEENARLAAGRRR